MDSILAEKIFWKWGFYTWVFLFGVSCWLQETPWRNQCLEHTSKELAQDCKSLWHWLACDYPHHMGKKESYGAVMRPLILNVFYAQPFHSCLIASLLTQLVYVANPGGDIIQGGFNFKNAYEIFLHLKDPGTNSSSLYALPPSLWAVMITRSMEHKMLCASQDKNHQTLIIPWPGWLFPATGLCQALWVRFAEKGAGSTAEGQALAIPFPGSLARPCPCGMWLFSAWPSRVPHLHTPNAKDHVPSKAAREDSRAGSCVPQPGDLLYLASAGWGDWTILVSNHRSKTELALVATRTCPTWTSDAPASLGSCYLRCRIGFVFLHFPLVVFSVNPRFPQPFTVRMELLNLRAVWMGL